MCVWEKGTGRCTCTRQCILESPLQTASPSRLPFLSQGERDCWRFLTRTRLDQAQLLLPPASATGAQLEAPQLPELRQDPQEARPQHLGHLLSLLPEPDSVVTRPGPGRGQPGLAGASPPPDASWRSPGSPRNVGATYWGSRLPGNCNYRVVRSLISSAWPSTVVPIM